MSGPSRHGPECAAGLMADADPEIAAAFGDPTVSSSLLLEVLDGKITVDTIRRHRRAVHPDLWPVGADRCRCERR